ncbi:hypothetical protein MHBO_001788 [Bonamia ostreae]|uniref:P-type ATPase C-terminal domain-containing protein n=1 Tax=Bonamia ostreae TaxID=126728 RepID=A0ABV2AK62_9EUKA
MLTIVTLFFVMLTIATLFFGAVLFGELLFIVTTKFLLYVLKAFIDVLLIYMVTYFVFDVNYNGADGKGLALCYVSYSIFTSMLAVMTIQVIFEIEKFNVGHVLSYMFSMPLWWVLTLSLNELSFVLDNQGCAVYAIRQIPMWIATFLSCLFCCIGQFFYRLF